MNPRLLDALSTVARMTACDTVPKREKISANSDLVRRHQKGAVIGRYGTHVLCEIERQPQDVEVPTEIGLFCRFRARKLCRGSYHIDSPTLNKVSDSYL